MTIERRVRVIADCDACDPRTAWETPISRMVCWHSRYNLGDEHSYHSETFMRELACEHDNDLEEELDRLENDVLDALYDRAYDNGCKGFDECQAYAERLVRPRINALIEKALSDGYIILPIYMYDHGGIALSTGSFRCPWDSGQVGWIFFDKETIDEEWDGDRKAAEKYLEREIAVYSDYVGGNVYGFIAEQRENHEDTDEADEDEWEEVDSCWGFYGNDPETNGIRDALRSDFADVELDLDCSGGY